MHFEAESVNELCLRGFENLRKLGTETVSDKGKTLTLRHVTTELLNPQYRYLHLKGRNNSLAAAIAETFWVLSGSTIVDGWLSRFLKRAKLYSDDGYSWYRGYGRMLYQNNQLAGVLKYLLLSPNTRQAVLSIYDPAAESFDSVVNALGHHEANDKSCNNILYFSIEDENKLNLTIANRSNDVIYGAYSINVFEFTFIQELVAAYLDSQSSISNYQLGKYVVFSNNYHVYLPDEKAAEKGNDIATKQFYAVLENNSIESIKEDSCYVPPSLLNNSSMFSKYDPDQFVLFIRKFFTGLINVLNKDYPDSKTYRLKALEYIDKNNLSNCTLIVDYALVLCYDLVRMSDYHDADQEMYNILLDISSETSLIFMKYPKMFVPVEL